MKRALIVCTILAMTSPALAQTPYGSCPQSPQYYQERFEANGQTSDMVCFQKALERDMNDSSGYSCPNTAQHYQTAYERDGRSDDMICFQKALERELQ